MGSPGIIIMSPTKGTRKPAPTDALRSLMGNTNPDGAPCSQRRERVSLQTFKIAPSRGLLHQQQLVQATGSSHACANAPAPSSDSISVPCSQHNANTAISVRGRAYSSAELHTKFWQQGPQKSGCHGDQPRSFSLRQNHSMPSQRLLPSPIQARSGCSVGCRAHLCSSIG